MTDACSRRTHFVSDDLPGLDLEEGLVLDLPRRGGDLSDELHAQLEEGGREVRLYVELVQGDWAGEELPPGVVLLALAGDTVAN